MKRGMVAVLIILLTFAVLIAAGTLFLLYRHFVTNRIMGWRKDGEPGCAAG